ncbi:MAG: 30S ribosome-binding factor RbfA [Paraclostridium sp.]|uniref:30S ribosome-binding factor RbfA n=1 Tax=Paraclostridium sp. TaxID=2023273 RepID=UPI003AA2AB18
MASYNRTQRIGEEIRKVVSTMLISGIKDYRINSLISVTDVEVTTDLSYAYVYVSILGGNKESSMAGLKNACGYIRKEVGKNVKLRHTPQIIFKVDDSIEKGMYMESLIKKVNQENQENQKDSEEDTQGE